MKTKHFNWILMASIILGSLLVSCSEDVPVFDTSKETHKKELKEINVNELLSVPIKSIDVSVEQAISAVRNKNQSSSLGAFKNREVESTFAINTKDGKPALYVINYIPRGYAVVSATRKYTPIISYNLDGHISLKGDTNTVIKDILDNYVKSIEYANTLPDSLTRSSLMQWEMLGEERPVQTRLEGGHDEDMFRKVSVAIDKYTNEGYRVYRYGDIMGDYYYYCEKFPWSFPEAKDFPYDDNRILTPEIKAEIYKNVHIYATKEYDVNSYVLVLLKEISTNKKVEGMLRTIWGQGGDYNKYIPGRYPVGCVSVAVSQIMKYHRYPKLYNWDDMSDYIPTDVTAQFLHEVALGVDTDFSPRKSSSDIKKAKIYLDGKGYFTEHMDNKYPYYLSKIYAELDGRFPVYAQGKDKRKGGHAFVIDGYDYKSSMYEIVVMAFPDAPLSYLKDTDLEKMFFYKSLKSISEMFHLNLGWNGTANGYYNFSDFYGFNDKREYLVIRPHK